MSGLAFHHLAKLIPEMMTDELVELERDIAKNGLRQPIVLYEGKILDGRHRYAVCRKLGIEPKVETFNGTVEDATALVFSLNVHRRHLTFEQKQKIIEAELKRDPAQSDRAIAATAKVSHPTVAKVREQMASTGDVEMVTTSTDSLGRQQPRRRKTLPEKAAAGRTEAMQTTATSTAENTRSASWPRKAGPVAIAEAILDALGDPRRAESVGRQLQRKARRAMGAMGAD